MLYRIEEFIALYAAGVLASDVAYCELKIAFRARSSALKQVIVQRGVGQIFFL